MPDSENKPRDIKDLKARLGRAASSPGTGVRTPSVPPVVPGGAPGSAPPGSRPPGLPFGQAPGSGIKQPLPISQKPLSPMPGIGMPVPGGIVAPPFLAPQKPGAAKAADPFAAGAAAAGVAAEKKITLVVDESAIAESATTRRSRAKNYIILAIGALLGIFVGFMVGNTQGDRTQYNAAVRDGKEIYKTVNEVSKTVDQAQRQVKLLFESTSGGPGKMPSVDYGAVEALVALKKPISANQFHRKRYLAFQPGTVDDLFDYYNNINIMWDKFARLGVLTAGKQKREALDKAAAATDEVLNSDYGLVMKTAGENSIFGGLVFVTIPQEGEQTEKKGKKGDESEEKVMVSTTVGGTQFEKKVFSGQSGITTKPGDYVIMVDKLMSKTIIGAPTSLFAEFRGHVMELNGVMTKTVETQGRLLKALGEVASLSETSF